MRNKLPHDIKAANSVIFFNKKVKNIFKMYFTQLIVIFIHNYHNISLYFLDVSSAGFVRMFLNTANK